MYENCNFECVYKTLCDDYENIIYWMVYKEIVCKLAWIINDIKQLKSSVSVMISLLAKGYPTKIKS